VPRGFALEVSSVVAPARPYPERAEERTGWHDRLAELLISFLARPVRARAADPWGSRRIVALVRSHESFMRSAHDHELQRRARKLGRQLRHDGFALPLAGECFALIREAASRTIGQTHFDTQLMAGWAMLQGRLAEMATGEGKTFAATLPACAAALAGQPVHVITVNDYLARRDAQLMQPLYRFLGLSVGTVVQGMQAAERRRAYACDIAYCTNKELAFDYLRDRVALGHRASRLHLALEKIRGESARDRKLVLRGLCFGIVDEADSVFVDEARTPLILSSPGSIAEEQEKCALALDFAKTLAAGADYTEDAAERKVALLVPGMEKLDAYAGDLGGVWTSVRAREELVTQALVALRLYRRDRHYVVAAGRVQIVDESTGRVMPDRSWERGLHQLIEAKEGCELTERRETLARITYQRLFRRYLRLAGMTGTASEVARELRSVYRLEVERIPLHRPSRRTVLAPRMCATRAEKWRAVADAVERIARGAGRPVLIGTRSVEASEELSAVLGARALEHALLNAKQDQSEAQVIASAGAAGRVTVATNMAGRGTDIQLGSGVAERGGLHVILTEYHESRRIDRQLFGRCARQGDPGSCQAIVSVEDDIFTVHAPGAARLLQRWHGRAGGLPSVACAVLKLLAQFFAERRNARIRLQHLKGDQRLDQLLAFTGKSE
jgi:preprotein translocase subunit SecA